MVDFNEEYWKRQKQGDRADGVSARFYKHEKYLPFRSQAEEKEVTIFKDYIAITVPGGKGENVFEANEQHKTRFRAEWSAYKNGEEYKVEGTPVGNLHDCVDKEQAALMKVYNISTIEQLAALHDAGIEKLGRGGRKLVADAKEYLEKAVAEKAVAEKTEIEKLKAELAEFKAGNGEPKPPQTNKKTTPKRKVENEPDNDSTERVQQDASV